MSQQVPGREPPSPVLGTLFWPCGQPAAKTKGPKRKPTENQHFQRGARGRDVPFPCRCGQNHFPEAGVNESLSCGTHFGRNVSFPEAGVGEPLAWAPSGRNVSFPEAGVNISLSCGRCERITILRCQRGRVHRDTGRATRQRPPRTGVHSCTPHTPQPRRDGSYAACEMPLLLARRHGTSEF